MPQTYKVEIVHQGESKTIEVAEDQKILEIAEKNGIILPASCHAGVCTTCAAELLSGEVDQSEGMGISKELQAKGYALLCVSYPRSDIKLETEKEEIVYDNQFGNSN